MLDQIIQEIERQGFSTRPLLLSPQDLSQANQFFLSHASEFQAAHVGSTSDKKRLENIRGDFTFWIDSNNTPQEFSEIIHFLNDLKVEINKRLFLGLNDFEAHLAKYPVGSFYTRHKDRHELKSTRVLSFVFYLNEEWKEDDGGELVIYDDKFNQVLKLLPSPGTFICFLSDEFPHEVKAANRERRSLTGWFHSTQLI